ncbi:uncharacterized protein [Choristoneura fumiferana]|uniref:uncharacterized protein n=1 Tax=Choristoneura fumiferana TaxID=7141 RepID=UPI003D155118
MSPLARSLLALAAAALLHSACAALKNVGDECNTQTEGCLLGKPHVLPTVHIRPGVENASVDIPNPCASNLLRVGLVVTACDDVVKAPTLQLPKAPFDSPVTVQRNGDFYFSTAEVNLTLWCAFVI